MAVGSEFLSVLNLQAIMRALQDIRTIPQQLKFLQRTPVVPALDDEIMARFIGRVLIADLITDDAKATTYEYGKFQFERNTPPNLKLGVRMSQSRINQLLTIMRGGDLGNDAGLFEEYLNTLVDSLLLGVRQRMESLIIAMHLDNFNYDRLGVKISGVGWGMPSNLNVVAAIPWSTTGSATPVTDILTVRRNANVRYGVDLRRVTMSTLAFLEMIATTEFQNRVKIVLNPAFAVTNLPFQDTEYMRNLAANMLGMEIELYDARYWQQSTDGTIANAPFLPSNKVILTDPGNDGDASVQDFAMGIVTETQVAQMVQTQMIGQFPQPTYGPVAYATGTPDLNPPEITLWGVARGFPRKRMLQASAVLEIGPVTDAIPLQGDLF